MIGKKWTVLLLREDTDSVRQFSLPKAFVRRAMLVACAVLLFLATATALLLIDSGARLRAGYLAEENRLLRAEMEEIRTSSAELDRELAALAEQDRRTRQAAGMAGIDEEVFEVGVGGPGLPSPVDSELWNTDPEASETAFAVRYDLEMLLRKTDLLDRSFAETEAALELSADRLRSTPIILPMSFPVSSGYSARRFHPVRQLYAPHTGVDQSAPTGTPFVATADGVVTFAGYKQGYGNTIEIDHGHGVATLYAHASKMFVRSGARVSRSEVIGEVGCTGVCTGPHVHYELHVRGRAVNPMNYVLRRE